MSALPESLPPGDWAAELAPGERLLWEGRPAAGLRLSRRVAERAGLGVVIAGIGVFWLYHAIGSGAPLWSPLAGTAILLAGLGLAAGGVAWDAWRRRHTRYALTDRRAIVATSALGRSVRSFPIAPDSEFVFRPGPEASIVLARDYAAAISFRDRWKRPEGGLHGVRAVERGFERIADGERVHALLRAIQRRAAGEGAAP